MTHASPTPLTGQDIAAMAARAGLRLRSDKVAVRVVGALQRSLADVVPERQSVLFAITAPIRKPAATMAALDRLERGRSSDADLHHRADGNRVHIRRLRHVSARIPKVLGFVHAAGSDPCDLLGRVELLIRAIG